MGEPSFSGFIRFLVGWSFRGEARKKLMAVCELSHRKTTGPELAPLNAFQAPCLADIFVSVNLPGVTLNQALRGFSI